MADDKAKEVLAIDLGFDLKTIKKALVMLDQEVDSDVEIRRRFINRKPLILDNENQIGEYEALQMCMGMMAFILAAEAEEKELKGE